MEERLPALPAADPRGHAVRTCRHCLFWKRRTHHTGTCWHDPSLYPGPASLTVPDGTCDEWTAKTYQRGTR
jgi:hypothetical protein